MYLHEKKIIIFVSYTFNTWKYCHHLNQNPKGPDASWRRKSLLQVFYSESSPSLQTEQLLFCMHIATLYFVIFFLMFCSTQIQMRVPEVNIRKLVQYMVIVQFIFLYTFINTFQEKQICINTLVHVFLTDPPRPCSMCVYMYLNTCIFIILSLQMFIHAVRDAFTQYNG